MGGTSTRNDIIFLLINVVLFFSWFVFFVLNGKNVVKYIKDSNIAFNFVLKLFLMILIFIHTVWTLKKSRKYIAALTPYWCLTLFLFFISTLMAILELNKIHDKKDKEKMKALFAFDLFYCIFLLIILIVIITTSIELKSERTLEELLQFPEQSRGLVNFISNKVISDEIPGSSEYVLKHRTEGEGVLYLGLLNEK